MMRIARFAILFFAVLPLVASAQISHFQHIVLIIQENRSPDNLFQGLCSPPYGACAVPPTKSAPYDIQTSNWKTIGSTIQPTATPLSGTFDLDHSHRAFNNMCDIVAGNPPTCQMDGAASNLCFPQNGTTCPSTPQYLYVDNSTGALNPYLSLATQYGWANYMFQTNQGPSFPAHQFLFGGTSAPSQADDAAGIFAAENATPDNRIVGCTASPTTNVVIISPNSAPPPYGIEDTEMFPCYDHQTMADLVSDWMFYSTSSLWTAPDAIQHICMPSNNKCPGFGTHVSTNPPQVLTDIGNCTFHTLTWVQPTGQNSDHPSENDGGGPSWVASVVNAIGNSTCTDTVNGQTLTYWQDTAIFITWDDWGGWYDHEPPTILPMPEGDYQYGFRVPVIVVSAYTDKHFVSNTRYDFGSILRFIEHNFYDLGLSEGELGFADERATADMHEFFHLTQAPRAFTTIPAVKDAAFFINDTRPPLPPDTD